MKNITFTKHAINRLFKRNIDLNLAKIIVNFGRKVPNNPNRFFLYPQDLNWIKKIITIPTELTERALNQLPVTCVYVSGKLITAFKLKKNKNLFYNTITIKELYLSNIKRENRI